MWVYLGKERERWKDSVWVFLGKGRERWKESVWVYLGREIRCGKVPGLGVRD